MTFSDWFSLGLSVFVVIGAAAIFAVIQHFDLGPPPPPPFM